MTNKKYKLHRAVRNKRGKRRALSGVVPKYKGNGRYRHLRHLPLMFVYSSRGPVSPRIVFPAS